MNTLSQFASVGCLALLGTLNQHPPLIGTASTGSLPPPQLVRGEEFDPKAMIRALRALEEIKSWDDNRPGLAAFPMLGITMPDPRVLLAKVASSSEAEVFDILYRFGKG